MIRSEPIGTGKVYSVYELTKEIKLHLEREYFNVWVTGEISNLKQPSSGHVYFTIKDQRSQLPAVMFRSSRRRLKFQPEDGMAVVARGSVTVYEPRGAYQLLVEWMEPHGKGALQAAFEQLKEKLDKEGLFAKERKKPLPLLPQKIGIVTSPTGAALRDICRILHRRFPNLEIVLYPAQVQGDLASAEIAQGIQVMNRLGGFDALIVGRGGGSLEDLWPFNEESVARAIAASEIPVMSAVGHEVDYTIADFVADVRAPTPSAAAEMVVSRKDAFEERVNWLGQRVEQATHQRMLSLRSEVDRLGEHKAFLAVRHSIEMAAQRLDDANYRAATTMGRCLQAFGSQLAKAVRRLETFRIDRQIADSRARLQHLDSRLSAVQKAHLATAHQKLGRSAAQLEALSPLAVLGRGYSLAWNDKGALIREASQVRTGAPLRLTLHRGELDCRVERTRTEKRMKTTS
jgi:exodeoxyribonuclease VII large subunit